MPNKPGLMQGSILSAFLLLWAAGSANAADPNAVATRLKDTLHEQGLNIAWSGVSGNDAAMVLSHVTASFSGQPKPVVIGDVTLSGITDDNGGYRIASITLPDYSISEPHSSFDLSGVKLSGVRIPPADAKGPLGEMLFYEHSMVQAISVKSDGKQLFTLTHFHVDATPPDGDKPLQFNGGADGFSADLSAVKDPKSKAAIEALGYENIQGTMAMQGSWSPGDGKAILEKLEIAVNNAGTLDIALGMSGYTPQFMQSLREVRKQMDAAPPKKKSAEGLILLGLVQQLSFIDARITYTDHSLAGKIINFVAAQEQLRPQDVVNQAKAVLPFMLAKLRNPEFSTAVSDAVSKFLDDPKSLTIDAAPPSPLSLSVLGAIAMVSPQHIPDQLHVTVKGNQ